MQKYLCALLLALASVTCGGGSDDGPYGKKVAVEPAVCAGGWQSVQVLPQSGVASIYEMAWLSDHLHYFRPNTVFPFGTTLVTIASDRTITSVPAIDGYPFTNDGQKLATFRGLDDGTRQLWTKSVDAQDWTLETTFAFAGVTASAYPFQTLLTAEAIYAGVPTEDAYLISRFDRATGAEQRLAAVRFPGFGPDGVSTDYFGRVALWTDWLFFDGASGSGTTFSLPLTGGEPVFMLRASGNSFGPLAMSSSGQVLFQVRDSERTSFLAVAPVGTPGPPVRWGTDLPRELFTTAAFDDGKGGWVLTGIERLADGAEHTTVFTVDAAGRSRRIACDPEVGRSASKGVLSPQGLYLAPLQLDPIHNETVFVPLP
ncbi:MAG: hypothetical protein KA712_17125 [Myxococcales bacterium]|nr:hypothetical protein [Myxococcales bacterium]